MQSVPDSEGFGTLKFYVTRHNLFANHRNIHIFAE